MWSQYKKSRKKQAQILMLKQLELRGALAWKVLDVDVYDTQTTKEIADAHRDAENLRHKDAKAIRTQELDMQKQELEVAKTHHRDEMAMRERELDASKSNS